MRTLSFLIALSLASAAFADTSSTPIILYQEGRLLDSNDNPVNETVTIEVTLYGTKDGPAQANAWSEKYPVTPADGEYVIALGDPGPDGTKKPLTEADIAPPKWMGISVNGQELLPRMEIGTVPTAALALDAQALGGIPPAGYAQLGAGGSLAVAGSITANGDVSTQGRFVGSAEGLSSLPSGQLVGAIPAGVLSESGVAQLAGGNTFTGAQTLNGPVAFNGPTVFGGSVTVNQGLAVSGSALAASSGATVSGGLTADSLSVSGTITGSGAGLTNLDAANVTGTFGSVSSSGTVTAQSFAGDGSQLSNVTAAGLDASARTDAISVAQGTTDQRPASPTNGMIRYNTTTNALEAYVDGAWVNFDVCVPMHSSQTFAAAGGASFVVPACVNSITVKAWGAGGGGGGETDGSHSGGSGGGGAYASSTLAVTPGESLTVIVGGGGGGGTGNTTNCPSSGGGGAAGTGYDGMGAGGAGANYGMCDAAGGGGGGGSLVLSGTKILLAAGGGGGGGGLETGTQCTGAGGGGGNANGESGAACNCGAEMPGGAAGGSTDTNGVAGRSDCNDGPGSGGGGGGLNGGGRGEVDCDIGTDCDNYPAGGGGGGTSLGDTVANGSGSTPGNATDADRAGAGQGGSAQNAGSAGLVKLSW